MSARTIRLTYYVLCQRVRRKSGFGQSYTWVVVGHAEDEIRAKIWKGDSKEKHYVEQTVEFVR